MKLLVADDDLVSRSMVSAISQKWGYEVVEANDGLEAWQLLQQADAPQLLLIDWMMPGLNGVELCERLIAESDAPHRYIILLTAKDRLEDMVHGFNVGADDYISKPFQPQELQARLNAGRRILDMQQQLLTVQRNLQRERDMIEDVMFRLRSPNQFSNQPIRYLQSGVEKTIGDIVLSDIDADGCHRLLLGDFTGHGLVAAIGAPVATEMFYSLCKQQLSMQDIINHINEYACKKLPPNLFLAAIALEVSADKKCIRVWNCAMHDVLIYRDNTLQECISSSNPALGILPIPPECTAEFSLEKNSKVYLYTDGIIEASNGKQFYGQERLEQAIEKMLLQNNALEEIMTEVRTFCGDDAPPDDITLLEFSS